MVRLFSNLSYSQIFTIYTQSCRFVVSDAALARHLVMLKQIQGLKDLDRDQSDVWEIRRFAAIIRLLHNIS